MRLTLRRWSGQHDDAVRTGVPMGVVDNLLMVAIHDVVGAGSRRVNDAAPLAR